MHACTYSSLPLLLSWREMAIFRTVLPSKIAHTEILEFSNTEYTLLENRKSTVEESMMRTLAVDRRMLTAASLALPRFTWNISVFSTTVSGLMAISMQIIGRRVSRVWSKLM